MIINYKSLFETLNKNNVNYFVFKGIEHLHEDILEARGDIDIFLNKNSVKEFEAIVNDLGFFKSESLTPASNKYYSVDLEKNKLLMLDVFLELPLWINKHEIISLEVSDVDVEFVEVSSLKVPVLSGNDRIAHNTLYYFLKNGKNPKEVVESLVLNNSNLSTALNEIFHSDGNTQFSQELVLSLLRKNIKSSKRINKYAPPRIKLLERKAKRYFGMPPNLCHSGALIAVVGVDGAGKSSLIERINENLFFQATGVKRIYFGYNEFKFPYILEVYKFITSRPMISALRIFPAIIMNIERKLRLLKAIHLSKKGNVVICDRYFYDDEVYYKGGGTNAKRGAKNFFSNLLRMSVTIIPDLSFYLDVSPHVAFERKQDFDYEKMKEVNLNYKNHMKKKGEVIFVDADKDADNVYLDVTALIFKSLLARRKC